MFFDLRKRRKGKCIYDEGLILATGGPLHWALPSSSSPEA